MKRLILSLVFYNKTGYDKKIIFISNDLVLVHDEPGAGRV